MKSFFIIFLCFASLFSHVQGEQTLSIIKPDAVAANHIGAIISYFEKNGLKMVAGKMTKLTKEQAEEFYSIHKERPFFQDLVKFMISGPIFVQVLEGSDAVAVNRQLMGATNPKNAQVGTIRYDFGTDTGRNAVHGSDSLENAQKEISFFFNSTEIYSLDNGNSDKETLNTKTGS